MLSVFVFLYIFYIPTIFAQVPIVLDPSNAARSFDGIGGLSGGGATSRLLIDYPEPQRSNILDYLFLPNFGASLNILKVEIGSDAWTSCGTEPTHMRSATEENYKQGYEFWLLTEAKKRNPNIITYGLPWGFPAWIGDGNNGYPLDKNQAIYQTKWVLGVKQYYNISIDYLGIWNERPETAAYTKLLRQTLNDYGLQSTKIVFGDGHPKWAEIVSMMNDTEFRAAVSVISEHYPYASLGYEKAFELGIPMWSSEDDSTFYNAVGTGCLARIINWNWVLGNMTSTIVWNLISSYYKYIDWWGDSLMEAYSPWSGFYDVQPPIWVAAHTTQFVQVGWEYLPNNTGSGFLPNGGSYVTMVSPDGHDFSLIIETMTTDNSQCVRSNPVWNWTVSEQRVTFQLSGSLTRNKRLSVWESKFFGVDTYYFEKKEDIVVNSDGTFQVHVHPDRLMTVTSTTGQVKGDHGPPPNDFSFPLPYADNFSLYEPDTMPKYFSDVAGSFNIFKDPETNEVSYRQWTNRLPISWCSESSYPLTVIGDFNYTDYQSEVSFYIEDNDINGTIGQAAIGARIGTAVNCGDFYEMGYFLIVNANGSWKITATKDTILAEGTVQGMSLQSWHTMGIAVQGSSISGSFDGKDLFSVNDKTWIQGWSGLGSGWHHARYGWYSLNEL